MNQGIHLRWRGQTTGPYTLAEIKQALEDNKIGLFHEAVIDGRIHSLAELLQQESPPPPPAEPETASQANANSPDPAPEPHESNAHPRPALDSRQQYCLRWRGSETGPFSLREIERMLDDQSVGEFHEIQIGDGWISLPEFFRSPGLHESPASPADAEAPAPGLAAFGAGARIAIAGVNQFAGQGARRIQILNNVSLVIEPNEFVGVLGPSGSGKSTLLDAMNGRRPAASGSVRMNGRDLYKHFDDFRNEIGCVPQKDIIHLPLTVRQEISFAARLRRPAAAEGVSLKPQVTQVINKLGLAERADTRNANLSGGQVKRVSLGVEAVSDPSLLFLDEATSGLDACTEARMMGLFRRLANEGRTVVCITHNLENVQLCDLVAVLHQGRLAYFGPTEHTTGYFGIDNINQVYDVLEQAPALEWAARFETSSFHKQFVEDRLAQPRRLEPAAPATSAAPPPDSFFRQLGILAQRYLTVILQDPRNMGLLLAQAPIIGVLLSLAFGPSADESPVAGANQRILGFLMAVSAIWFGCINAAREIVKELPVYLRERAINLRIDAYFASKAAVLWLLCAIQCASLILVVRLMTGYEVELARQFFVLWLTSAGGMTLGLLISGIVNSGDKAMAIIPIILIPQVVFAGAITPLNGFSEWFAEWTIVAYWAFDAMLHTLPAAQFTGRFSLTESLVNISLMTLLTGYFACYVLRRKDPLG